MPNFILYKISKSILQFFFNYKILTSLSTVFIKAHIGYYNF